MTPLTRPYRVRYYDLVLALIPSLFGVGWLLAQFTAVPVATALVPIGTAAMGLIAHALFVRPPTGIEPGDPLP